MGTTQPSEPTLIHSAAQLMPTPDIRLAVLQRFVVCSFGGSINSGNLGEMASTIILMLAFDEVLLRDTTDAWPMAVPLAQFTDSLLGAETCSSMHGCVETDGTMKSIWESGFMFFNHFQRLQKPPTEETLRTAFDRGCGLLLPLNFPGIDIILPVHCAGDSMSFFAVSIKNRKHDNWAQGLKNETTSSFTRAAAELELGLPFLGLTMALRGRESKFGLLYPSEDSPELRPRKKPKTANAPGPPRDPPPQQRPKPSPKGSSTAGRKRDRNTLWALQPALTRAFTRQSTNVAARRVTRAKRSRACSANC
jgi:hypothetical protein